MSRIAKSDVTAALARSASIITQAGGADGRTSRAELKASLASLSPAEQKLTDVFFKFIDHRDFRAGAQVTKTDVDRAVAYAKEKLVAKYDLNRNGLSKAEVKAMSLSARLAVDLARELKAAAAPPLDKSAFFERVSFGPDRSLTSRDVASIPPTLAKQIIAACQEAELADVRTLADAFKAVDGGEFVVREGVDQKTGSKLVSVDFSAGGNVAGAIFDAASTKMKVSIQDGEFFAP
ncbi:MAG: hypothetical protein SFW67_09975 [Myxococcaceae bacterium]|nr:hypothetical protein [Myxococcaceae bacterium]